jgi:hypothetical protein
MSCSADFLAGTLNNPELQSGVCESQVVTKASPFQNSRHIYFFSEKNPSISLKSNPTVGEDNHCIIQAGRLVSRKPVWSLNLNPYPSSPRFSITEAWFTKGLENWPSNGDLIPDPNARQPDLDSLDMKIIY